MCGPFGIDALVIWIMIGWFLCFDLDVWTNPLTINNSLLLQILNVNHVVWVKVMCCHFQFIILVLLSLLMWFIQMFGELLLTWVGMGTNIMSAFLDDHCGYTWIYVLHSKADACSTFIKFYNVVTTQFQTQIKHFAPTLVVNTPLQPSHPFYPIKASFTKNLVHTHHNKMGSLKGKIGIFLRLFVHY